MYGWWYIPVIPELGRLRQKDYKHVLEQPALYDETLSRQKGKCWVGREEKERPPLPKQSKPQ